MPTSKDYATITSAMNRICDAVNGHDSEGPVSECLGIIQSELDVLLSHPTLIAVADETAGASTTTTQRYSPQATSLLDLPIDVVSLILPHCGLSALATLARTCRTMKNLAIPVLYTNLDLSFRGTLLSGAYTHASWIHHVREQKSAIHFLLRNPAVARLVRNFKLTIGANYNFQSSMDLYRLFELLKNVEYVDIDGLSEKSLSPDDQPLSFAAGFSNNIFPQAKTIKLRGILMFCLVERIFLGGRKSQLALVEMDKLRTVCALGFSRSTCVCFGGFSQFYVLYLVTSRAEDLKSYLVDGKEQSLGPYDAAVSGMTLEGLKKHFNKREVRDHFMRWVRDNRSRR